MALFSNADIPTDFPFRDQLAERASCRDGGSAIAGPDGEWIASPVSGEERLVIADADPAVIREERHNFDPIGHHAPSGTPH
ncbi:hypothetical protein AB0J35_45465 [Nonomuraea angiospora]|uniref:hypothetical protein n=1 Tax=Nonomuraea angiospora TaxID=46172 RepID=UPI003431CA25